MSWHKYLRLWIFIWPDGILIAGDIYDKAVPSAEAVKVFDTFLSELADRGLFRLF